MLLTWFAQYMAFRIILNILSKLFFVGLIVYGGGFYLGVFPEPEVVLNKLMEVDYKSIYEDVSRMIQS